MVSTLQIVCTGRKIISQLLKIDGSFFVPYFTLILCPISQTKTVVLLVCMEWFQGSSCYRFSTALPRCFPKANTKVRQTFGTHKHLKKYFSAIFQSFLNIFNSQQLIKTKKNEQKPSFSYSTFAIVRKSTNIHSKKHFKYKPQSTIANKNIRSKKKKINLHIYKYYNAYFMYFCRIWNKCRQDKE